MIKDLDDVAKRIGDRGAIAAAHADKLVQRSKDLLDFSDAVNAFRAAAKREEFVNLVYSAATEPENLPDISEEFKKSAKEYFQYFKDVVYSRTGMHKTAGLVNFIREPIVPAGLLTTMLPRLIDMPEAFSVALALTGVSVLLNYIGSSRERGIRKAYERNVQEWCFRNVSSDLLETGFKNIMTTSLNILAGTKQTESAVPAHLEITARRGLGFNHTLLEVLFQNLHPSKTPERRIFDEEANATKAKFPVKKFRDIWRAYKDLRPVAT